MTNIFFICHVCVKWTQNINLKTCLIQKILNFPLQLNFNHKLRVFWHKRVFRSVLHLYSEWRWCVNFVDNGTSREVHLLSSPRITFKYQNTVLGVMRKCSQIHRHLMLLNISLVNLICPSLSRKTELLNIDKSDAEKLFVSFSLTKNMSHKKAGTISTPFIGYHTKALTVKCDFYCLLRLQLLTFLPCNFYGNLNCIL